LKLLLNRYNRPIILIKDSAGYHCGHETAIVRFVYLSRFINVKPNDILDRKLILNDTKSGKEQELIFIPQKVANRLKEYVREEKLKAERMILCLKSESFSKCRYFPRCRHSIIKIAQTSRKDARTSEKLLNAILTPFY